MHGFSPQAIGSCVKINGFSFQFNIYIPMYELLEPKSNSFPALLDRDISNKFISTVRLFQSNSNPKLPYFIVLMPKELTCK